MRITAVSTAVIEANFDWTIVRIDTDEGISGLGEAFFSPGLTAIIRELTPLLIGRRPEHVERHVRRLQLLTAHGSAGGGVIHHAISGIETALLDLNAKSLDIPLWRLLGGKFREKVRVYADCHAGAPLESYGSVLQARPTPWLQSDEQPSRGVALEADDFATHARSTVKAGFTTMKFDLDLPREAHEDGWSRRIGSMLVERQVEIAEAIFDAVGHDAEVAFDLHWSYAAIDALGLARRLEHLPILWLEDPCPPDNVEALARVARNTTVPIATGENQYTRVAFADLITRGGVDVVTPDPQKIGGLLELRAIAALADTWALPIAPHNISSPIGTVANAHACASVPNFIALEWHSSGVPFFDALVGRADDPVIQNGHIALSDEPGIGVELDLDVCRRHARAGEPFFA